MAGDWTDEQNDAIVADYRRRAVRCAWLLNSKANLTTLVFAPVLGLSRSTGQSFPNPLVDHIR